MTTLIRPELSTKNKYWISKHRHYELKHFCLQYPTWKKTYAAIVELSASSTSLDRAMSSSEPSDLTAKCALKKAYYSEKIKLVEQVAMEADQDLWQYILKAVTEGYSYTYLSTKLRMPCSRDTYYNRYRRFFWLLSEVRDQYTDPNKGSFFVFAKITCTYMKPTKNVKEI